MPLPKPHYQPQFTAAQLAEARKVAAQHSAPVAQVRRARLALTLAADDETVYKWRRRWATQGWSLTDAPRSGRPRGFPPGGDEPGEGAGVRAPHG
jgi:hypothetical protein